MSVMWGIFVGLGLGVLEIVILKKLIAMMTATRSSAMVAVPITILKLALILAVLFLMARFVSLESMIWCAAGTAIAMIGLPVASSIITIRKYKRQQHGGEQKQ
ncbi:hypothetical protein CE91St36_12390 [Christensenellaceae bacterium]|nr:hypothetical protein CE91St36_12390 [Christensenellaceae bacterium]BDF61090.1 hypothetical protein CE91St37_12400 [Christensenellaceae bacterium]